MKLADNLKYDSDGSLVSRFSDQHKEQLGKKERFDEIIEEKREKMVNLQDMIDRYQKAIVKHERDIERKLKRVDGVEELLAESEELTQKLNDTLESYAKAKDAGEPHPGMDETTEIRWQTVQKKLNGVFHGRGSS